MREGVRDGERELEKYPDHVVLQKENIEKKGEKKKIVRTEERDWTSVRERQTQTDRDRQRSKR